MRDYCGWFYTQGVCTDAFGNEIQTQLCETDDISSSDFTVNKIQFVHELYFVMVTVLHVFQLVTTGIHLDIDMLDTL